MPLIDAHCHLDHRFGGSWCDRPASELIAVLDEAGVDRVVDLSGGWGTEVLHRHLDHFKAAAPERFTLLGGIDWRAWSDGGDRFGEDAARSLEAQLRAGASGLKVWKTLGLEAVDHRGSLVAIDDPRLDPVWSVCDQEGVPVVIHVGDPIEFFRPLEPANARSAEISAHPEWHWHERTHLTAADLVDQFERLVQRWPGVRFVGAHLLDLHHDAARLAQLLERHPNLSVDLGARFPELALHRLTLLDVLAQFPDRVLYGLDHPPGVDAYRSTVATTREALEAAALANGSTGGLDEAVSQVLHANAASIFAS